MKLTKQKLEHLIIEMMEKRFTHEQENKIYDLIKSCKSLMDDLVTIRDFLPPLVNHSYSSRDGQMILGRFEKLVSFNLYRSQIMKNYTATLEIISILDQLNQYMVLLEDLELEPGAISKAVEITFHNNIGPTVSGYQSELIELDKLINKSVTFMEDLQSVSPDYFIQGGENFDYIRRIGDAFGYNLNSLKNYITGLNE